jgi:hypothetical protein
MVALRLRHAWAVRCRVVTVAGLLGLASSAATAQESQQPRGPTSPRPAHERLAVFEGVWTTAERAAGVEFRETCSWMDGGRRHMICRARSTGPQGVIENRTIYSYRGRDSTYVVTALLANGQLWTYHGRPDGGRWVFHLQDDRPGSSQRLRMTVIPGEDRIRFVEESSEDGGPWRLTEDYTHILVSRDTLR